MTLRIIGKASSINVRKVLWACEDLGVAYEHCDDGPERRRNPNGPSVGGRFMTMMRRR